MKTIKATELEAKVLTAIADSMYAEYLFSDAGLDEVEEKTGLSSKVIRGVISSLVKKGLVDVDDRESEGYKNNVRRHIFYLRGGAEGLVSKWVEEMGGEIEPAVLEIA